MTWPLEKIESALACSASGMNPAEIAVAVDVPRRTVSDWVRGRVPRVWTRDGSGCPACGQGLHHFGALPVEYAYLLGMYLGDGCVSAHRRGVFSLRIALDARYPGIIAEVKAAVGALRPGHPVGLVVCPGWVVVNAYSKSWPCFFPQHGPGKKHQRSLVLADWQAAIVDRHPELFLRGLIHSDGCRFMNTGRGGWRSPRYSFTNLSGDIKRMFCDACDLLELHWTVAPPKSGCVSRKADVARMDEFIGPKK